MAFARSSMSIIPLLCAVCASAGALGAIVRRDASSACSRYARKHRAAFNYGKDKTAVMALLGSPSPLEDALQCEVVDKYRMLGILIDNALSFLPLLHETLGVADAAFTEVFHAAESGGNGLLL